MTDFVITHDIDGNFFLLPFELVEQFDTDDKAQYSDPVFAEHGMPVISERAQEFQEKYAKYGIEIPYYISVDDVEKIIRTCKRSE